MKSIKEKAEEYSIIEEGIDLKGVPYKDYNNYKMEGFEAGANYVLEEIDKIINHPLRFVNADKTVEDGMIEEISKLVEQLKK